MTLNSYLWPGVHTEKPNDADALEGIGPAPPPTAIRIAVEGELPEPEHVPVKVNGRLIARPADLVVLPPFRPSMAEGADAASGLPLLAAQLDEVAGSLTKVAETHQCMIAMGGPLADGRDLFDAVMLALPDGTIAIHRSTHPCADRTWALPADEEPLVVRTAFGLVGLLTGDELLLPELARGLAVRGAEFAVAVAALDTPAPTGLPATQVPLTAGLLEEDPLHWLLPRVRAAENNMWLAFANNGALPSGIFGPSFYRSPRREALASHGPAQIDLAVDHADRDRRLALEKPYLRMRPAHLYTMLTQQGGSNGGE
jgi:predicted amidohydrolase